LINNIIICFFLHVRHDAYHRVYESNPLR
jgi:hypothetical protein